MPMNAIRAGGPRGFSLIELIVSLAVVAILAAIALPSYQSRICASRRGEGKALLYDVLAAEERYYLGFNRYTDDAQALGLTADAASSNGYYALAYLKLADDDAQIVDIGVAPQGSQTADRCGELTLDSIGHRGASVAPAAECW